MVARLPADVADVNASRRCGCHADVLHVMVRIVCDLFRALALLICALLLASAKGCPTTTSFDTRLSTAAAVQGRAVAKPSLIVPPAACTAKVGRVRPGGEPWVISQLRWETITYNRDRLTDARIAWAADINARNSAPEDQIQ